MKSKLLILIVSTFLILFTNQTFGFKPNDKWVSGNVRDYHLSSKRPQNHRGITGKVLASGIIKDKVNYKFSDEVIEKIKQANSDVDAGLGFLKAKFHCDGEQLEQCSMVVQNRISTIVKELTKLPPLSPDYDHARKLTGQALHTVQDFYAHSNYPFLFKNGVKNSLATIESGFNTSDIEGSEVKDRKNNKTCEWDLQEHWYQFFYNEKPKINYGSRGKVTITTGYFQVTDPDNYKCRHGDIRSGIHKDAPGRNRFLTAIELSEKATKHFIETIFTKVLKSGIANPEKVLKIFANDNEVRLGIIIDTSKSMASSFKGVKSAVSGIVTDIKDDSGKNISDFLIMDYGITEHGFPILGNVNVVHDPSTMKSYINSIRLAKNVDGSTCEKPAIEALSQVVQVAPEGTELFLYTDAGTTKSSLSSSIITLAKAKKIVINFFLSGSCIISKFDSSFIDIAKHTGGSVYKYEHTESGAERTFDIIKPKFDGNFQSINKIVGTLPAIAIEDYATESKKTPKNDPNQIAPNIKKYKSSQGSSTYHIVPIDKESKVTEKEGIENVVKNTSAEHKIYIDSTVTNLQISVNMSPLADIKLYGPDGKEEYIKLVNPPSSIGETISVYHPQSGEWRIKVTGVPETKYLLDVKANSDIHFVSFSFSEVKGRHLHQGLFPINGQPIINKEQFVVTVLSGTVDNANLIITSLDGVPIDMIALTEKGGDGTAKKFVGRIRIPKEEFRIFVKGKDVKGKDYQRLYPNVYSGQVFSVKPVLGESDEIENNYLAKNKSYTLHFNINNLGGDEEFIISATNSLNYPIRPSATEIRLDKNEDTKVAVTIDIPKDAQINSKLYVILEVTSKINDNLKNTAISSYRIHDDTDKNSIP